MELLGCKRIYRVFFYFIAIFLFTIAFPSVQCKPIRIFRRTRVLFLIFGEFEIFFILLSLAYAFAIENVCFFKHFPILRHTLQEWNRILSFPILTFFTDFVSPFHSIIIVVFHVKVMKSANCAIIKEFTSCVRVGKCFKEQKLSFGFWNINRISPLLTK